MKITKSKIEKIISIENITTTELAELRQALTPELSRENQKLADALNQLSDSIENGNKKDAKKNATSIIKEISSSTLTNVLSKSVFEFIKGLAEN